ncbi:hypothetical protein HXX76_015217 [Chlamydomonas incerta]|uniref:RAP domain-containing protein n=1 Tax=Chlamydomonas incerta TaxID=51695 RepID=A0A835SA93_CHLIN|nr:hypothetical protein HXX76_015217 [Chlamydomonas incerta]|eukprot:KAG2423578.1 hypothetical protein HXX76_015217 [Chlamydomonas incerta]
MGECRTLEELQGVIDRRLTVWSQRKHFINMSAAFTLCGKLESAGPGDAATAAARASVIAALAPALLPLVPRIRKPTQCSIVLWALAKVGRASSGNGDAPVTAAQLLAVSLLQRLADTVVLAEAKPQELANALWALAKLREDQRQRGSGWDPTSSPHLATLAGAVASRLSAAAGHGFKVQELSNILWACAKLGYRDSEILQLLAAAAVDASCKMNEQHLANSLWALGALSCSEPEYSPAVRALCGEALRRLRTEMLAGAFKPQELSNILIALAGLQLGGDQAALVAAVAVECARRDFAGFKPQDISNSAWALAKMGYGVCSTPLATKQQQSQQQWYAAAVAAAQRPGVMAGAIAQEWANLLYALALVRHQPPPSLLDAAGAASAMHRGKSQECANTLWALGVLQLRHGGVEAAVCGRLGELLQRKPESVAAQGVCNSLWALAVLGGGGAAGPPAAADLALALACEAVRRHAELTEDDLCQLWQAQRALGGEVVEALARSPDLQAAMEAAVAASRRARGVEPTTSTQQQVVNALHRLQQQGRLPIVSVRAEVAVAGVLGPVDVVLDWSDGRQVAVEVDGPDHFFSNRQRDPSAVDGSTALRNRQLRRALGAGHVLCVPYWEWYGLSGRAEQEAYLLRRLQQAVQPLAVQSGATVPAAAAAGVDSVAAATAAATAATAATASAATARARAGRRQKGRATQSSAVGGTAAADTPAAPPRGGQQPDDTHQPQRQLLDKPATDRGGGGGGGSSQTRILTTRRKAPPQQQQAQKGQQGQQLEGATAGAGAGVAVVNGGGAGAAAAASPAAASQARPAGQQAQQRGPRRRMASVASSAGGVGGGGAGGAGETPPPPPPPPQRGSQGVASAAARRSRRLAAPPAAAAVEIKQQEQLAADAPGRVAGGGKRRRLAS